MRLGSGNLVAFCKKDSVLRELTRGRFHTRQCISETQIKEFSLIGKRGFDLWSAHRNDSTPRLELGGLRDRDFVCRGPARPSSKLHNSAMISGGLFFFRSQTTARGGGLANRHSNTPKAEATTSGTAMGKPNEYRRI
jgi:hypothetical protein